MAITIEEFVAFLGWEVDSEELDEFDTQLKEVTGKIGKFVAAVGAAGAALTTAIVYTNQQTAEMANLAESVGLSTEGMNALAGVLGGIGLEAENVVDLVEEMNNKFGEKKGLGEFAAVDESLKMLNLEFKNLENLSPEDQLIRILDAAKDLDDHQRAVSAVDMLLGGEANKALGFLRTVEGSLADIIERRRALNFLTNEGAADAKAFSEIWLEIRGSIGSMFSQFSAVAGNVIRPIFEETRDWIIENRKLIQTKIVEWAELLGTVLKGIWWVTKQLIQVFRWFADAVGGAERALALLAATLAVLGMMSLISSVTKLAATVGPLAAKFFTLANALKALKLLSIVGLLVAAGLAVNSLFRFFQGKDSLVGDIGEKIAEHLDDMTGEFAAFFGLTKEEFQIWLVDTVHALEEAGKAFWEFMTGMGEEIARFETWGQVWQWWADQAQSAINRVVGWLRELFAPLIGVLDEYKKFQDWGQIWNWWADQAEMAIKKVMGWISRLMAPLRAAGEAIKSVFGFGGGDDTPDERSGRQGPPEGPPRPSPPGAPGVPPEGAPRPPTRFPGPPPAPPPQLTAPPPPMQTPSPAAAAAMTMAQTQETYYQNRGPVENNYQFEAPITIQGGQSSATEIADEVARTFRREADAMVRQSGSGVVY